MTSSKNVYCKAIYLPVAKVNINNLYGLSISDLTMPYILNKKSNLTVFIFLLFLGF